MPKPTPHTATRKTRSQSPPRLVQRTPVSQMQPAMLRSSTGQILPAARALRAANALQKDLERQLGRAAATHEVDRAMEVDVEPRAERLRGMRLVAGPLELCDPPPLDLRQLAFVDQFSRSHGWALLFLDAIWHFLRHLRGRWIPFTGDFTVPSVRRNARFRGGPARELLQNANP